jgi:hypothetical protein
VDRRGWRELDVGQVIGVRDTVEVELMVCSRETAWATKNTGLVCHV